MQPDLSQSIDVYKHTSFFANRWIPDIDTHIWLHAMFAIKWKKKKKTSIHEIGVFCR